MSRSLIFFCFRTSTFFKLPFFIFIQFDLDLWVNNIDCTFPKHGKNLKVFLFQIIVLSLIFHNGLRFKFGLALLPLCPFAFLPFLPFCLLPFCPFARLPFCPFALISHNALPLNFALALAIYVAIEATFMAKFEGKGLCDIRAKGQK